MKSKIKEAMPYIIIIVVILLARTFIITPIKVNGPSMNDTLKNGDVMILMKYNKNNIKRFNIVVLNHDGEKLIKRVVGMPGEDIEYKNNKLYINGKLLKNNYGKGKTDDFKDYCPKGYYFVMGDNRENSLDSRYFSCVDKKDILGTTSLVLFPFNRFGVKK